MRPTDRYSASPLHSFATTSATKHAVTDRTRKATQHVFWTGSSGRRVTGDPRVEAGGSRVCTRIERSVGVTLRLAGNAKP